MRYSIIVTFLSTLSLIITIGCIKFENEEPTIFNTNDCITRKNENIGVINLVVDKTKTAYVMCQGHHGESGVDNYWYGCEVRLFTGLYNEKYEKIDCPNWKIIDSKYGNAFKSWETFKPKK